MELALLPGWSYRPDALNLLFGASAAILLFGALPVQRRYLGLLVFTFGLLQAIFAGQMWGHWLGLEIAGLGLLAWGVPNALQRHLAAYPLLLAALFGGFDVALEPGLTPPTLPLWAVLAVAATVLFRASCWPFGADAAKSPPLNLYGLTGLYVLLRTLDSGPWDSWARLVVLLCGLLTLVSAVLRALGGPGVQAQVWRFALAVTLVGLGIGTPPAVAGAAAMLLVAAPGLRLLLTRGGARVVGAGVLLGLPPLLGFAGIWLLLAGAALADYPLVVVVVPVGAVITGAAFVREAGAGERFGVFAAFAGAVAVAGGLAGEPAIELVLRPALNVLAAGLPALREVGTVPGLGLSAGTTQVTSAIWPATALAVCLLVALALSHFARQIAGRFAPAPTVEPAPPASDPLLPAAAATADLLDLSALWRGIGQRDA